MFRGNRFEKWRSLKAECLYYRLFENRTNLTRFIFVDLQVRLPRVARWEYGPRPTGPKEIDGVLAFPCNAYTLLTDHLP